MVDDLLCIEFDGTDDSEAFPTSLCLTGFTAHPYSAAAQAARHLLGETLCRIAEQMVRMGDAEREVLLDESVRDSRVRAWRRLTGLAIGIEILPGELRAVLVGADGEIVERERRPHPDMSPDAVTAGIAALVADIVAEHRAMIAGTPVHLGVQIGGPVDSRDGRRPRTSAGEDRAGPRRPSGRTSRWPTMIERATGLRTHVLNDVVGYATYDRWFYPSPDERCRAVLLISQGIGAKLIIDRRRGDAHADGDRQLHAARERRAVRVRQARMPRGHRQHRARSPSVSAEVSGQTSTTSSGRWRWRSRPSRAATRRWGVPHRRS